MTNQTMLKQEIKTLQERVASLEKELAWQAKIRLALQVSEERFRSTFDNMREGVQIIDYDGCYLYLNVAAEKHNRRPNQELLGRKYTEIWPGIESRPVFAMIKRCMEERVSGQLENRFAYLDGSIGWFELKIQPVPEGILILSFDITERKQAEKTSQLKDELLHLTGEMAQVGGWEFDADTLQGTWTDEVARIHDLDPEQATNVELGVSFYLPQSRQKIDQAIKEALELARPYDLELEMVSAKGQHKWVRTMGLPITEGSRVIKVRGIFQDVTERKQAEAKLRESEARFHGTLDAMQEGVLLIGRDWRYLYINKSAETQGRRLAEELLGKTVMECWPGFEATDYFQLEQKVMQERLPAQIEGPFTFPDSETHWFRWNIQPAPEGLLIVTQDITESKQAEQERHIALEKYRVLFETFPLGISVTDAAGNLLEVNRESERLLGISRENHTQRTYDDPEWRIVRPDGTPMPPDEYASVRALQEKRLVENVEMGIVNAADEITWLNVTAVPLSLEGYGVVITYGDITERKRVEEELRESEERYRKLLEFAPVAIAVHSDGKIVFINRTGARLLGATSEDEIIGRSVLGIIHPAGLNQVQERMARLMAGEQELYPAEDVYVKLDGTPINVEVTVTPLLYRGKPAFQAIVSDITERKRAEAELQETLKELKRSNAELEQFAYIASHDLQEPLRAVAGMVQLLQKKYQGHLDERADLYINHLVEAAARMQRLINDLLVYSRVGRRGQPFAPVNTVTCVQLALKNLEAAIHESRASITWDNLPTVTADSTQLSQLLQNLIGNALKFRGDQEPQIHISAVKVDKAWQFSVRDNGIGIEPQYFERIFQVFQRLHTREEYPGTGIGLALCQKIVERHGGVIWVESQMGQGSTFYFTLPLRSTVHDS
ncbi:MAG: PAS domain S-box protein [Anaerolineae bacterium]